MGVTSKNHESLDVRKILAWESDPVMVEFLRKAPELGSIELIVCSDEKEGLKAIGDVDVAVVPPLDKELLAAGKRLKWVHTRGGGVEGFLFPELLDHPVLFSCSKPTFGNPGAEFALAAMLMISRRNHLAFGQPKEKYVTSGIDHIASPEDLEGKTLGILGLGYMGRTLAPRARALGMHVVAATRRQRSSADGVDRLYTLENLGEFLGQADYVAVCLPMTDLTRDIVDGPFLDAMKRSAFLIDLSARIRMFDWPALVRAIESGNVGGICTQPSGLDETIGMPPLNSDFWQRDNVIVSPCRGTSAEQELAGMQLFLDNLRRIQEGEPLEGLVDKESGY